MANPGPLHPVPITATKAANTVPVVVAAASTAQTIDWIIYSDVTCHANWDQVCDGSVDLVVPPPAWQVCQAIFAIATNTGATSGPNLSPHKWFTVDPVEPVSFRGEIVTLHAAGNNLPPLFGLPSQGAVLSLTAVGLRLIAAQASLADRITAGCELPAGP